MDKFRVITIGEYSISVSLDIYRNDVLKPMSIALIDAIDDTQKLKQIVASSYSDKKGIYIMTPYTIFDDSCIIIRKNGALCHFIKLLNEAVTVAEIEYYDTYELGNQFIGGAS